VLKQDHFLIITLIIYSENVLKITWQSQCN